MISFRISAGEAKYRSSTLLLHSSRAFRVAAVLAFSFLLCLQTIGQTAESDGSETETLRGTVVNPVTQAPIPRALVYSADNRYTVLSDGDGHFEFTVPKSASDMRGTSFGYSGPAARFWSLAANRRPLALMARKPGYLDPPVEIGADEKTASGNDITIPLLPEGIIKGRVTATGAEPATGVAVQLLTRQVQEGVLRWVPGPTVQANSAGEFRFAELLPGSYKLFTREWMDNDPVAQVPGSQVYGFPPVYYPGGAEPSAAAAIELDAGQTVQADIEIQGKPYHQVRIPVANADVNNGFSVTVEGQQGSRFELGFNTNEQRIEGMLPAGNYTVQATTYGPNSVSGSVSIRVGDAPVQGPTLVLGPNTNIASGVKEEFGDPPPNHSAGWSDGKHSYTLRGPRLYLQARLESVDEMEPRGAALRPPTPPDDQSLALEGVPPGRYWLRVSTSRGYIASATMGSLDLLHQPFTVSSGTSAAIEITMRDDGGELDGTISSAGQQTSAPESGTGARAFVYCVPLPESAGQFQPLVVSEDGKFNAQMMAPGDYRIVAFSVPRPNLPYRDAEAMKAYESQGQVVHLSAGQKTAVQLQNVISAE
ncbi:MAG: carboxypeptidase-like regulatory domain-containing protein [Acidobacteriota bacterium]